MYSSYTSQARLWTSPRLKHTGRVHQEEDQKQKSSALTFYGAFPSTLIYSTQTGSHLTTTIWVCNNNQQKKIKTYTPAELNISEGTWLSAQRRCFRHRHQLQGGTWSSMLPSPSSMGWAPGPAWAMLGLCCRITQTPHHLLPWSEDCKKQKRAVSLLLSIFCQFG